MTIRSLEIFECVARHGKMSAAAEALYIAQPTISKAIAELEKEYGVQLFDRLSKKLFITEAGRHLLGYAQEVLRSAEALEKGMANLAEHKTVLLGATMTVGKCVLVDIVKSFETKSPDVQVSVTIDNTRVIEEMLLQSQLDLALVEGHIKSPELKVVQAMKDSLVLVCHPAHPLAVKKSVPVQTLSAYPFILREEGSGTRESFMDVLHAYDVRVPVKWSCHGFDAILQAVLANQGLTVISQRIAAPYAEQGTLKILPVTGIKMQRSFNLVYHKTKYISPALNMLMQGILE